MPGTIQVEWRARCKLYTAETRRIFTARAASSIWNFRAFVICRKSYFEVTTVTNAGGQGVLLTLISKTMCPSAPWMYLNPTA